MESIKKMQERGINANRAGAVNPKELLQLELLTSFEKYTKAIKSNT